MNKGNGAPKKETDPYAKKKKINPFSPESTFMAILTKIGQLLILNVLWVISIIPIITFGTATCSFYYSVMKSIRRGRSYPVLEYWNSFKRTLGNGVILTIGFGALTAALLYMRNMAVSLGSDRGKLLNGIYIAILAVIACILVYLFPVLSRFTMKLSQMIKLSLVMAIRFLPFTILIIAGTAALIWAWFYFLPIPLILVWPGAWMYTCTFLIEKALRKYMPPPKEGDDAWYYE